LDAVFSSISPMVLVRAGPAWFPDPLDLRPTTSCRPGKTTLSHKGVG